MEHRNSGFTELGVIGAGLMGAGLAQVAAAAGLEVLLFDTAEGAVDRAFAGIRDRFSRDLDRGRMTAEEVESAIQRLRQADDLADLGHCDAVIEAVIEDLEIKQRVFSDLAEIVSDHTLLASNTSALPITDIAATCSRPDQVIGMHFFSPVPAMRLCEIIRGYRTSEEALAQAERLAAMLGKETIVVNRDDAGFVTSRLMTVLIHEATRIVEEGLATPEEVDRACELGFGHRMGPLATADLTGVDVAYRAGRSIFQSTGDSFYRPPQLLRRMVAAGAIGRKAGEGFYDYEKQGSER